MRIIFEKKIISLLDGTKLNTTVISTSKIKKKKERGKKRTGDAWGWAGHASAASPAQREKGRVGQAN